MLWRCFLSLALALGSSTEAQPDVREPVDYIAIFDQRLAQIPEADRAYPLLAEVAALLVDHRSNIRELSDAKPGDSAWAEAEALLAACRPALDLSKQIAAKPHLGYHLTWPGDEVWRIPAEQELAISGEGTPLALDLALPHLGVLRDLCKLERLEARRLADSDQTHESVECIARIRRLSELAAEQTITIARLVAIALDAQAIEAAEELLETRRLDDISLVRLRSILSEIWLVKLERSWLVDDDLLAHELFQNIYPPELSAFPTREGFQILRRMGRLADEFRESAPKNPPGGDDPERSEIIDSLAWEWVRVHCTSYRETLAHWNALVEATVSDAAKPIWEWSAPPGSAERSRIDTELGEREKLFVASILHGPFARYARTAEQLRPSRDAVILRIALEQFQRDRGELPASLTDLVPDFIDTVPVDWADGRPMRYRTDPDGSATLYSLGPDRDDDGGTPTPPGQELRYFWPDQIAAWRRGDLEAPRMPDGDWVHWSTSADD